MTRLVEERRWSASAAAAVICMLAWLAAMWPASAVAQQQRGHCNQTAVEGFVLAGQRRIEGVLVQVLSATGEVAAQTATDGSGSFRFSRLPPETYAVTVKYPGFKDASTSVDLRLNCMANISVIMEADVAPAGAGESPNSSTREELDVQEARVPQKELDQGIELLTTKKNPAGSIPHFQKVVSQAPKYAWGHVMLGTAYMSLNRFSEAQGELQTAVQLNPRMAPAQHSLGLCLKKQGKIVEAETPFLQAVSLDPSDVATHFDLGALYIQLKRPADAEAQARAVAQLQPQLAAVHFLEGNILLLKQDPMPALAEFENYLQTEPQGDFAPQARQLVEKIKSAIASATTRSSSK